jgi:hypothetical protein
LFAQSAALPKAVASYKHSLVEIGTSGSPLAARQLNFPALHSVLVHFSRTSSISSDGIDYEYSFHFFEIKEKLEEEKVGTFFYISSVLEFFNCFLVYKGSCIIRWVHFLFLLSGIRGVSSLIRLITQATTCILLSAASWLRLGKTNISLSIF